MTDEPFQIPEAARQQIAEAEAQEQHERAAARQAGVEAARRRQGRSCICDARHNSGETLHSDACDRYTGAPRAIDEDRLGVFADPARSLAPETSLEAAKAILPRTGTDRRHIYDAIRRAANGMTDEEIEKLLGLKHQTASARRYELVHGGWVRASGKKRPTSSGRNAVVWEVVDVRSAAAGLDGAPPPEAAS